MNDVWKEIADIVAVAYTIKNYPVGAEYVNDGLNTTHAQIFVSEYHLSIHMSVLLLTWL